jgi:limonene-1,2-epoxide hydrolase
MAEPASTPLEVVRAFLSAMERVDYDAALPLIKSDCEYTNGPLGTVHGPAGVRAMLEPFFASILENRFVVAREVVTGPMVVIERLDRHRLPTGWVELPVTGVFEVHGGLITVWHEYFDVATLQKQMSGGA